MTMLSMMYVMVGGAFGSLCRYLLMVFTDRFNHGPFPYSTLLVNVLGAFLLGAWLAAVAYAMPARPRDLHMLLGVGVLGGFTTFSAFSLDIFLLLERGLWLQTALYAAGSVFLSVLAMVGGMFLIRNYVS
jgi:CrcB protein